MKDFMFNYEEDSFGKYFGWIIGMPWISTQGESIEDLKTGLKKCLKAWIKLQQLVL